MCTKNAKIRNVCHLKVETCLSVQFTMLLSPTSPLIQDSIWTMKCRYIHNICKTHPRSHVAYLSIVSTHAQKEAFDSLDLTGPPILKILVHLTLRKKSMHSLSLVTNGYPV